MWIQDRDYAEEPIDSRDRGILCGGRQEGEQVGDESQARVIMQNEFAVQSFNCLVSPLRFMHPGVMKRKLSFVSFSAMSMHALSTF
jgi:hypothetical protein